MAKPGLRAASLRRKGNGSCRCQQSPIRIFPPYPSHCTHHTGTEQGWAMVGHRWWPWWGTGDRQAAAPHDQPPIFVILGLCSHSSCRLHKISYFWAKHPATHQPPQSFTWQRKTSTCTKWNNWSTREDPSCHTLMFTTTNHTQALLPPVISPGEAQWIS